MPSTPLRRRVSVGVLSTGLVAGVLIPLSTASAATCASWADEAGDSTTDQSGVAVLADAQLDIVSAAFGTVGKDVVGTITTDGLSDSSSDAGDEFRFRFTIADNDVIFYVDRTAPPLAGDLDVTAGFYNFTTDGTGEATAEFDVESKTVRLTGPIEQLAAAVGAPVAGLAVSDLRAETLNQVALGSFTPAQYDDAPTPAKPVIGTACTFGGKPAPAASAGPSAAPSASAGAAPSTAPSASPSAAPSGSAAPSSAPSPEPSPEPEPEPEPEPAVPVPAPGCIGFEDAEGDSAAAIGPAGSGDDPDLDLRSVTGRTTDTTFSGHLGVTELSSGPSFPTFTGHRFEFEFAVEEQTVVLQATGTGDGTGLLDGSVSEDLVVTAVFDEPSSQVVLTVERAGLAKALGREIPDGTTFTDLAARSYARTPATATVADTATAEDPARGPYPLGDNTCFAPKLTVALPGTVQTSDVAVVNVVLTTADGRPAPEQKVTARIGAGRTVSATTSKQGATTLSVPVSDAAGLRELLIRSAGTAGEGELRTELRVVLERALLSVRSTGSGASRTLTATLTDDDAPRGPLAGQRVVFTFDGRSVAATTNRAGRAVATVPTGSAVEVVFAGRSGFLTAAKVRARG